MAVEARPCVACKRPTKGVTCSLECGRKWYAYLYATPLPRQERTFCYEKHDGPATVNDTGDYRPPVRKPRERR